MFCSFIAIECNCICCIVVSIVLCWCYSNRIICVATIIYCYCFTSCIFNSIFRYGYFILSTRIIYSFTACNRNISNVSITSCSCFFNYAFSRSCATCRSRAYCIDIMTICAFAWGYSNTSTSFNFSS